MNAFFLTFWTLGMLRYLHPHIYSSGKSSATKKFNHIFSMLYSQRDVFDFVFRYPYLIHQTMQSTRGGEVGVGTVMRTHQQLVYHTRLFVLFFVCWIHTRTCLRVRACGSYLWWFFMPSICSVLYVYAGFYNDYRVLMISIFLSFRHSDYMPRCYY